MYGLTPSELQTILQILQMFPEIDEAVLFGSRAMGREKRGSDIDIALKGVGIESIASDVSQVLNSESPLPYYFDIIDYYSITEQELRDHIDRVGKTIYSKNP